MDYIENNLMNGERVVCSTSLHWVVFLWPIIWLVVAVIIFGNGGNSASAGVLFLIIAIIAGISAFVNFKTSEFGITNKRMLVKVGFIRRNSLEVLLTKVEGIEVNQGILGRILGFGSITVRGTGGSKDPFHNIVGPLEFRKRAQEQIASVQDSK